MNFFFSIFQDDGEASSVELLPIEADRGRHGARMVPLLDAAEGGWPRCGWPALRSTAPRSPGRGRGIYGPSADTRVLISCIIERAPFFIS
jgi:hypothetical protein